MTDWCNWRGVASRWRADNVWRHVWWLMTCDVTFGGWWRAWRHGRLLMTCGVTVDGWRRVWRHGRWLMTCDVTLDGWRRAWRRVRRLMTCDVIFRGWWRVWRHTRWWWRVTWPLVTERVRGHVSVMDENAPCKQVTNCWRKIIIIYIFYI